MGGRRAWVWVQGWKEHDGEKVPLIIEELLRGIQALPSRDSEFNVLSTDLRRPGLMVTAISEAGQFQVL